jgi:arylsulfatase A-like enzyme
MNPRLINIWIIFFGFFCAASAEKPNIIFILVDDMGYSDLGCFGGEIDTPNIDKLAADGLRFTQFYNTSKCFPSRACLLTGVYAQQSGMAEAETFRDGFRNAVTIGEVLKKAGYRTLASGKHHSSENLYDRGFDHFYGLLEGACNYWNPGSQQREGESVPGTKNRVRPWADDDKIDLAFTPPIGFYTTDAFTDKAIQWLDEPELKKQPFFLYLAYTAPHYPLHAWPEDIAKYKGRFDAGYELIREERYRRMVKLGIIDQTTPLPAWTGTSWRSLPAEERALMSRRMEVYAAMLDRVDQNIGRVLSKLESQGKLDNTLIMFASDNGACAELPLGKVFVNTLETIGSVESYDGVYEDWATVQNTPLRFWKNHSHEGGINSPFIVYWHGNIVNQGSITHQPGHFIDVMTTLVEITGAHYPERHNQQPVTPMQGVSLLPIFSGGSIVRKQPLYWHWGHVDHGGAIRENNLKAVFWNDKWELFDLANDRNEMNDLSQAQPQLLQALQTRWKAWHDSHPEF